MGDEPTGDPATQTEVLSVSQTRLGTVVTLEHISGLAARFPFAPASLWSPRRPAQDRVSPLTFDRVLQVDDGVYEYLAFDRTDVVTVGERYLLQSHFHQWQYVVMLDRSINWRREPCPREHDHCILTWAKIWRGEDAYTMDGDQFITEEAHERLIVGDPYRLRGDQPTELHGDPDAAELRRLIESGYRWETS